jgi:hypothetical protein
MSRHSHEDCWQAAGDKAKDEDRGQLNDEAGGQGEDEDPGEDVRADVSHSFLSPLPSRAKFKTFS